MRLGTFLGQAITTTFFFTASFLYSSENFSQKTLKKLDPVTSFKCLNHSQTIESPIDLLEARHKFPEESQELELALLLKNVKAGEILSCEQHKKYGEHQAKQRYQKIAQLQLEYVQTICEGQAGWKERAQEISEQPILLGFNTLESLFVGFSSDEVHDRSIELLKGMPLWFYAKTKTELSRCFSLPLLLKSRSVKRFDGQKTQEMSYGHFLIESLNSIGLSYEDNQYTINSFDLSDDNLEVLKLCPSSFKIVKIEELQSALHKRKKALGLAGAFVYWVKRCGLGIFETGGQKSLKSIFEKDHEYSLKGHIAYLIDQDHKALILKHHKALTGKLFVPKTFTKKGRRRSNACSGLPTPYFLSPVNSDYSLGGSKGLPIITIDELGDDSKERSDLVKSSEGNKSPYEQLSWV